MIRLGLALCLGLATLASSAAQPVRDSTAVSETAAPEVAVPEVARSTPPDAWLGRDKALHAGGSALLTLGGTVVLAQGAGLAEDRALPVAAGTTLALGVMKELTDRSRERAPLFSWRDLVADTVGVAVAALVVSL